MNDQYKSFKANNDRIFFIFTMVCETCRWSCRFGSGASFSKCDKFCQNPSFWRKSVKFSKLSWKMSFYESYTKFWWWVDLRAHIRNKPVGNAVWPWLAFEKEDPIFSLARQKTPILPAQKCQFLKIEPKKSFYESYTKFWWWVDFRAGIS